MNQAILARPAGLPAAEHREDPMRTKPRRPPRTEPSWSQPSRRGPAATACRLVGRLFGLDPDRYACWCIPCTLHHLGVYRREHVRYGKSAYVRTTLFGIRVLPDRYAFPLNSGP